MLNDMVGAIRIAGHTDDVPISTSQFRSNWDLSAMRATTVAHRLLATGIDPRRLMVSGHADTQPRMPNDTPENRALNRRIDITLVTSRVDHTVPMPAPESEPEPVSVPEAAAQAAPEEASPESP